mgnify:FL=1
MLASRHASCILTVVNRRLRTVTLGALPVLLLTLLATSSSIPGTNISLAVPFAAMGPGPSFNTLGDFDGKQVVDIQGAEVDKTSGNFNMTTVAVRQNMSLAQAVSRWISSSDTFVPIDQVIPRGQSREQTEQENQQAFLTSESAATLAAMNYLKRPVEVEVMQLVPDSAASGKLSEGDVITAVDGTTVTEPAQVREIVQKKKPGDEITVTVKHDDTTEDKTIKLGKHPDDENTPLLGVTMGATPSDGVKVDYNLEDIGGPSAGLMFALAVVDKLSPGELNGGKFVAGTGTIDDTGKVGAIGGIEHKVKSAEDLGAEVFLAPADNCKEAIKNHPKDMTMLKVTSLEDAIHQLDAYNRGDGYTTCG